MSRLYDAEEALNLILDGEADSDGDSDGELAEPMCPGSDEEFECDIDDRELFTFDQRYKILLDNIFKHDNNITNKYMYSNEDPKDGNHEVHSNNSEPSGAAAYPYNVMSMFCVYMYTCMHEKYLHVRVCVCVMSVCVRVHVCVCVCVCVCIRMCM